MQTHPSAQQLSTSSPRYGVLIINVGTPTQPTPSAIRQYLKVFLSDRHVVPLSPWLWQPILRGWILNTRPFGVAKKYAAIWLKNGSPLMVYSQQQEKRLQQELKKRHRNHSIKVKLAMRCGDPSIASAIKSMHAFGVTHLAVLPLYPQYATPTTTSAIKALYEALLNHAFIPNMYLISHFSSHPSYIGALAESVRAYWHQHGQGDRLLISFHGLPQQSLDRKEPYFYQCHATANALVKALNLAPQQWVLSFQSRFGNQRWLQPYTEDVLQELGQTQMPRLDVICPSFMTDCLETLHDIKIKGSTIFHEAGGGICRYIPCLNSSQIAITALADIVSAELGIDKK